MIRDGVEFTTSRWYRPNVVIQYLWKKMCNGERIYYIWINVTQKIIALNSKLDHPQLNRMYLLHLNISQAVFPELQNIFNSNVYRTSYMQILIFLLYASIGRLFQTPIINSIVWQMPFVLTPRWSDNTFTSLFHFISFHSVRLHSLWYSVGYCTLYSSFLLPNLFYIITVYHFCIFLFLHC